MTLWLLSYTSFVLAVLVAYALFWRSRRDLAAHIYVHKGAVWFVWLISWVFILAYLASRPMVNDLTRWIASPADLAKSMLSMLGVLLVIYLGYLILIYPFFASLRPALSKESLGIDWQLDVYVEDKISGLVEETPLAPLLLLDMGLAEALQDTPAQEHPALLKSLWIQYVPVVTGRRATGAAYLPDGDPDFAEPDLNLTIRLALETSKIIDNREEKDRRYNVLALPLMAGGRAKVVFAAYWPKRRAFRGVFSLVAQQYCIIRSQYVLAAEVSRDRLAYYDSPWIEENEGE